MSGMLVVRLIGGPRDGEEVQCYSTRVDELREFPGRAFDTVEVLEAVGRRHLRGAAVPDRVEMGPPEFVPDPGNRPEDRER